MSLRKPFRAAIESLESRLLFAIASPQPVARPEYNTSSGFFVREGAVYDGNGYPFTIRGFSHTTWWGDSNKDLKAIAEFNKAQYALRKATGKL